MNRRGMTLAFVLYLTVDLSSPFVPGAFNFDPDECVDGIHRASSLHERADATALPTRSPVARLVCLRTSAVRPPAGGRHAVLAWLVDSREDSRASGDLSAPSEDH